MADQTDVVVLGLGPGGEALATRLAEAGLEVVGVDRHLVGGECPYYGCIPTKMIVRAADALEEARRLSELAGTAEVTPSWRPVAERIASEATDSWDDRVAVERLEAAGVRFVRGHGRLVGDRRVEVGGSVFAARRGVVLNTGTEPAVPPIEGLADTPYWTNRDAVATRELPGSLVVVGGGAIGAELTQAFARFGVEVTLLEVADHILPPEEPEAGAVISAAFAREGVRVLTGASIQAVAYDEGRFVVRLAGEQVTAEKLLVATGRRPNIGDIGLDAVGLDPSARAVDVDGRMRAGEGLWAIGDITGKGGFTHVSMYQSAVAARDILGEPGPAADYRAVPRVTFTDPEVGSVGLTEAQARQVVRRVRVGTTDLSRSTRGWIHRGEGVVKLVEDADRGVLVGATVVAPAGGEVLSMLTTAVHAEVPIDKLGSMIYAYPTFHRAVQSALDDLS
jgi:pyruvate/2-oxoglutarate dehydrogenase complex dihydrolipoamide dehydrogenase (E3) component